MGSKGSKKRKKTQHLPKVGTPAETQWAEHEKRREVMGDVGIHKRSGAGSVLTWVGGAIVVALVLAAILFLALR